MANVSQIIDAIDAGDALAAAQLLPLVYDELRRLAAAQIAHERPGQTLDATALVHEAYLHLVGDQRFQNRRHFFVAAAEAMRRILVENARRKRSRKRGGDFLRSEMDPAAIPFPEKPQFYLDLDDALARLAEKDPAKAELVKLRYFAGLTLDEAAATLAISPATADRWWTYAKAWLRVEMVRQQKAGKKSS